MEPSDCHSVVNLVHYSFTGPSAFPALPLYMTRNMSYHKCWHANGGSSESDEEDAVVGGEVEVAAHSGWRCLYGRQAAGEVVA